MVKGRCWRHSEAAGSCRRIATDGQRIYCKDVFWAVVETVAIFKSQFHCDKAVVSIEPDVTRTAVFETCLRPGSKDVTGSKNCLGRDYCLDRVLAIEAQLPMCRAIGECQRKVAPSGAQIIQCGGVPVNGHRNW